MNMAEISPVSPIDDQYRNGAIFTPGDSAVRKPVDSKIQELVLSQIHNSSPSMLLASATSPNVVIALIPGVILVNESSMRVPRKQKREKAALKRGRDKGITPVGIERCELFPAFNAILQLILFLPVFREAFSFAPRSYQIFTQFVSQYSFDQESRAQTSSADSTPLLNLLKKKMPASFFSSKSDKVEIKAFIYSMMETVFGHELSPFSDSLTFHPEWSVSWNLELPFASAIQLTGRPIELFVKLDSTKSGTNLSIQRQFFTKPDCFCYDLDAFVEYRPDGKENGGYHITYLKMEGAWYQCDDHRITPMRSTQLNQALNRSILLHYRRIWPKGE